MISFCDWPLMNDLIFVGAAMKEYNGLDGRQAGTETKSGSCFSWSSFFLLKHSSTTKFNSPSNWKWVLPFQTPCSGPHTGQMTLLSGRTGRTLSLGEQCPRGLTHRPL